jgi:hypothetical protein
LRAVAGRRSEGPNTHWCPSMSLPAAAAQTTYARSGLERLSSAWRTSQTRVCGRGGSAPDPIGSRDSAGLSVCRFPTVRRQTDKNTRPTGSRRVSGSTAHSSAPNGGLDKMRELRNDTRGTRAEKPAVRRREAPKKRACTSTAQRLAEGREARATAEATGSDPAGPILLSEAALSAVGIGAITSGATKPTVARGDCVRSRPTVPQARISPGAGHQAEGRRAEGRHQAAARRREEDQSRPARARVHRAEGRREGSRGRLDQIRRRACAGVRDGMPCKNSTGGCWRRRHRPASWL